MQLVFRLSPDPSFCTHTRHIPDEALVRSSQSTNARCRRIAVQRRRGRHSIIVASLYTTARLLLWLSSIWLARLSDPALAVGYSRAVGIHLPAIADDIHISICRLVLKADEFGVVGGPVAKGLTGVPGAQDATVTTSGPVYHGQVACSDGLQIACSIGLQSRS